MEEYYYLKKGEIIQEGDESGTMKKYNDDDYTWVKETRCVGEPAPDPQYMSHRRYRRLVKDRIWTEEENELRQLDNIMNPEGKTCMNCQWSNADKEGLTTCGHHIQNFTTSSFCGYWTDNSDPKVLAYFERRKAALKTNKQ